jgi:hypothetical protein
MTRKPKGTYPNTSGRRPTGNVATLRRRAEAYRDRADELEAVLADTQDQFTEAFAVADAQMSTRDRISKAARGKRQLGGVGNR